MATGLQADQQQRVSGIGDLIDPHHVQVPGALLEEGSGDRPIRSERVQPPPWH